MWVWLHHTITQIEPFQVANERVARVLASLPFLGVGLPPLLVRRGDAPAYRAAQRCADEGDLAPLVGFVREAQRRLVMQGL